MPRRMRRRTVSMTSLIDVIFLLLLFFMLSSTFTRFGGVEMRVGGAGPAADRAGERLFLRLEEERLSLNGVPVAMSALVGRLGGVADPTVIVSVRPGVTAQRMTDLLVTLRDAPEARVMLLGGER